MPRVVMHNRHDICSLTKHTYLGGPFCSWCHIIGIFCPLAFLKLLLLLLRLRQFCSAFFQQADQVFTGHAQQRVMFNDLRETTVDIWNVSSVLGCATSAIPCHIFVVLCSCLLAVQHLCYDLLLLCGFEPVDRSSDLIDCKAFQKLQID